MEFNFDEPRTLGRSHSDHLETMFPRRISVRNKLRSPWSRNHGSLELIAFRISQRFSRTQNLFLEGFRVFSKTISETETVADGSSAHERLSAHE